MACRIAAEVLKPYAASQWYHAGRADVLMGLFMLAERYRLAPCGNSEPGNLLCYREEVEVQSPGTSAYVASSALCPLTGVGGEEISDPDTGRMDLANSNIVSPWRSCLRYTHLSRQPC